MLEDTSAAGGLGHPEPKKWLKNYDNLFNVIEELPNMELEQEVGISHRSIHAILSDDLKMRRVSAKLVPKELTTE
jgi:hypothetical protein